jgi:hypothetical protein
MAHPAGASNFLPLFLTLSLSLSLTGEQGSHTLFTGQIEIGRERRREGEKEIAWTNLSRSPEIERGRERERCPELLF